MIAFKVLHHFNLLGLFPASGWGSQARVGPQASTNQLCAPVLVTHSLWF